MCYILHMICVYNIKTKQNATFSTVYNIHKNCLKNLPKSIDDHDYSFKTSARNHNPPPPIIRKINIHYSQKISGFSKQPSSHLKRHFPPRKSKPLSPQGSPRRPWTAEMQKSLLSYFYNPPLPHATKMTGVEHIYVPTSQPSGSIHRLGCALCAIR